MREREREKILKYKYKNLLAWEIRENCTATKGTKGHLTQVLKLGKKKLKEERVECFHPNTIGQSMLFRTSQSNLLISSSTKAR